MTRKSAWDYGHMTFLTIDTEEEIREDAKLFYSTKKKQDEYVRGWIAASQDKSMKQKKALMGSD